MKLTVKQQPPVDDNYIHCDCDASVAQTTECDNELQRFWFFTSNKKTFRSSNSRSAPLTCAIGSSFMPRVRAAPV